MAKHQNLSSPYAVHPFAFSSNADPANDGSIDMAPYKGWINTGSSNTLKVRNAANTAWEDVSVAGAATTPAFGSNSNSVAVGNASGASTLASRADHVHLGVRSIAHASNTFSGPITLTTPGNTVGITSPGTGQLAFTATGGGGGGSGAPTDAQYLVGALNGSLSAEVLVLRGRINTDGTTAAGSGFSAVKNVTGDYTVTYSSAFGAIPLVLLAVVSPNDTDVRQIFLMASSATAFHVLTTTFPGVNTDCTFSFAAIAF